MNRNAAATQELSNWVNNNLRLLKEEGVLIDASNGSIVSVNQITKQARITKGKRHDYTAQLVDAFERSGYEVVLTE